MDFIRELRVLITSVVYALVGMGLLFLAYRVFDMLTPTDMQKAIFEENKVAVSIAVGFFMLGMAVVIHGALAG